MSSAQTINLDPSSQEYRATLALIRGLEIAGGEAGFRQWAAAPRLPAEPLENPYNEDNGAKPPHFPNSTNVSVYSTGPVGIRYVSVKTTELRPSWSGSSGCFTPGFDDEVSFEGQLDFAGVFPVFAKQTAKYRVVKGFGVGAVLIQFLNDDNVILGQIGIAIHIGGALLGMKGPFKWQMDWEE